MISGVQLGVRILAAQIESRTQPWCNPFVESFGSNPRGECLNRHSFWSLIHARVVITDWKQDHNHDRPYSSLGYLTR